MAAPMRRPVAEDPIFLTFVQHLTILYFRSWRTFQDIWSHSLKCHFVSLKYFGIWCVLRIPIKFWVETYHTRCYMWERHEWLIWSWDSNRESTMGWRHPLTHQLDILPGVKHIQEKVKVWSRKKKVKVYLRKFKRLPLSGHTPTICYVVTPNLAELKQAGKQCLKLSFVFVF